MTEPSTEQADDSVITSVSNGVGRIELNRPKLINALSQDMVTRIDDALQAWRDDDTVSLVLVTGRGERGLCAGGDIKAVYNDIVAGSDENAKFWNREYKMNFAISEFPKPYVVIMNGITMGGGVGISGHGSHRIVTDSTKVGMPETGIGLFPDVGGTHLLANAPGELGTHLALTGQPVGAGSAIALGLADHYVPDAQIPDLIADLTAGGDLDTVIGKYTAEAPADELAEAADWINECYAGDEAEAIVAALAAHENPDAQAAAELIATKAPTSVKVTLAAVRNAETMTLAEVLEQDYRVAVTLTELPDLKEGIRAQVIDKDRNPKWSPASLAEVSDAQVQSILTTDHAEKVFS
ncbi:enoyl-CoA hydratase/isomerase family protein [Brevibacterium sp. S111]|jgi:enoyl-CoA hydratase|uniref:enoyl-CoA hydratase/isomerase family protein n=1 Tax=unclassified Brevibacterium TaxID=2614124 RepID=UPI0010803924|nr:enoyl-CoA hydratase/isomerase family protein [Brevibacterium sp. S111]TGD13434.1 enoyl-CoA hydratase/isomerase family protein [Brevibacterium sp. S111]